MEIEYVEANENVFFSINLDGLNEKNVYYNGRTDKWICTCENGSMWAVGREQCKHVKACKKHLENERKQVLP